MFDDYKSAVVLDIFWRLLEFQPQLPKQLIDNTESADKIKVDNMDRTGDLVDK